MGIKGHKMSRSVGRFLAYIRSISFSCAILSGSLEPLSHFLPLLLPNFTSELSILIVHFFNVSSFSICCSWASWPFVGQTNYLPKLPVFLSFSCVPFTHLLPSSWPLSSRHRSTPVPGSSPGHSLSLIQSATMAFLPAEDYCSSGFHSFFFFSFFHKLCVILHIYVGIYITSSLCLSFRPIFPTASSLLRNHRTP